PGAVRAAVAKGHVRVFTIGLHSGQFAPEPLRRLATSSGGSFAEATTVDRLAPIYRELGRQLSNEYLLRYKSLVGPKQHVNVRVTIAGMRGDGAATYISPALDLTPPPVYHPAFLDRLLQSPGTALLI